MSKLTREDEVVIKTAFKQRHFSDGFKFLLLPMRVKAYRWRQLHFRKKQSIRPVVPYPTLKWAGQDEIVDRQSGEFYSLHELPSSSINASTFRAAGGRRLPLTTMETIFTDIQDAHAWQRLYWLLEGWDHEVQMRLETWLDQPLDDYALHPYTTSERIRVIAEVLGSYGQRVSVVTRRQLVTRLRADAEWLFKNIETNLGVHNHLLNNARALCAAGYLLAEDPVSKDWLHQARSLWDEYWPQLILDDGLFSEQSSHYHVLLTRTLLEYIRDARLGGRDLPPGMLEKAQKMCGVTNILVRSDGTLPLFGDISPDMPTVWLRGISLACHRAGLLKKGLRDQADGYAGGASAFFSDQRIALPEISLPSSESGWHSSLFPRGGLLFVENKELGIELTAHGDPRKNSTGHGDTGRGSFEIWFKGRRIVVDGGIPTYQPGVMRENFRGAAGQNGIAIDGLSPTVLLEESRQLPGWYVDSIGGGIWHIDSTTASFIWSGFERHRSGLKWVRTWRWKDNILTIEDKLEGWQGRAKVEGWLHFGESDWQISPSGVFTTVGCQLQSASPLGLTSTLVKMPHAADYGVIVDSQGIYISGHIQFPVIWSWRFEFDSGKL